jgi:outer membrane protein assembly factor BamB
MSQDHRRKLRVAAGFLAALVLAACSKDKSHEPAKLVDIPKPAIRVDEAWSSSIGDGSDGLYTTLRIALTDKAIYVASVDGRVEALNPDNGNRLWRIDTKEHVISGPSASSDFVLVGTQSGRAIALQGSDGKQLWSAQSSSEVGAPLAGDGGTVVVRTVDGRVYGLDPQTGERRWGFDRSEPELTLRGMSAPLVDGSHVLVGLDNGRLVSLNLSDGATAWEQPISVPSGRTVLDRITDIDADLLMGNDGLFVVTYGSDLAAIDPSNGQAYWRRTVKSYSGMTYSSGRLYVTNADGEVLAFDATSGSEIWKQQGLKYRQLSAPALFGGYLVVGDFKGYLHWISTDDGHFVARERLGSDPIVAPMVAGPKYLYVMNADGKVGAFSVQEKK